MNLPIQRLGERARASYASHLSALPRDDVRLRFGAPLGRDGIDAYVARIDFDTDALFAAHDDRLEPTGVAHVGIVDGTAELGVSVLPGHRGRGLGSALVARALDHHPELLLVLRGVDAANLEQVQPTWVLRPLFDLMRAASEGASRRLELARPAWRALPFRATLHAGEDFLRVFEGVRRMHEAIEFGVLRQGDRFGHGLAVGVDPTTEAGTVVAQSREERLDDLLWELDRYALGDLSTTARVERVRHEARELAVTIYRADAASDLEIVRESRRMRHDPALLVDRWRYPLVDLSLTPGRFSEGLFVRYLTDRDVYARGQVMVAVRSTADERVMLAEAQRWLRRELARREVTIESNPSSNLLIGDLRSLDEHPAMRLQPIRPGESRDDAVLLSVNTDNPVTFASCLADEFAHLYTALLGLGVPSSDALAWIDRRREDGWRSRFTLEASALPGALERVLAPELNRAP